MLFEIAYTKTAQKELKDQVEWYNNCQPGLGFRFIEAVDNRLNLLIKNPEIFPEKIAGYHEAIILDFPFLIIYKILKSKSTIRIFHIFHTKRNPMHKTTI